MTKQPVLFRDPADKTMKAVYGYPDECGLAAVKTDQGWLIVHTRSGWPVMLKTLKTCKRALEIISAVELEAGWSLSVEELRAANVIKGGRIADALREELNK